MKIEITRIGTRAEAIRGMLYIDGKFVCHTLENRHTALPAGTYSICRHYCKQYDRFMPVVGPAPTCDTCKPLEAEVSLNTVMPCLCPMLKAGNGVHHRKDGSILLGTETVCGCLTHPLRAFEPMAERIRKSSSRNNPITLTVCL